MPQRGVCRLNGISSWTHAGGHQTPNRTGTFLLGATCSQLEVHKTSMARWLKNATRMGGPETELPPDPFLITWFCVPVKGCPGAYAKLSSVIPSTTYCWDRVTRFKEQSTECGSDRDAVSEIGPCGPNTGGVECL